MQNLILAIGLSFLLLGNQVQAADPICADACLTIATNFVYSGCSDLDDNYYACRCINLEFLGTLAICIEERCAHEEWEWIDVEICQGYGESAPIPSYETVIANATKFAGPIPDNTTEPLTYPLDVPDAIFQNSFDTSHDFIGNMTDSSFFGWLLCMFAGILCIIGAIQNHILPMLFSHHSYDLEGGDSRKPPAPSKIVAFFKRYFLLPATFGSAHVRRPFFLSIPLRSQSILIFIYVALNVIFLCVHYHLFEENVYWPEEESIQLTRYVADRSGILAFAQIPLLIAFAGRNNILIWLTGWSFTTFNVWHKWIARVCLLHAFIHSVAYTVYAFQEGGAELLTEYYKDVYLQYGAVGTVAASLLCFQAMYVFRLFWYEVFLALHILLAIAFMVGCWYHVNLLEFGHMEWLYAAVALWAFDRVARWARMALLNISWSKGRKARTAHLQIIGPDAIKAEISVGYNFNYQPGQYIYVYFPRFNFWESHPFTITSYELSKDNGQPTVCLLFRTHGGVTRKLQKYLADGAKDLSCLVEGPYGHYCPVDKYDKVLLLAGGVGITAVFPYLQYLSNLNINRVHFVWVVRDEDSMRWLSDDISKLVGYENFDIEIHITKSRASGPGVVEVTKEHISDTLGSKLDEVGRPSSDGRKVESNTTALARHIHVDSKPSLRGVIAGYAKEHGSLAVLACGPDTFVDETRAAVAENVTIAKGVIDYYEEAFTW